MILPKAECPVCHSRMITVPWRGSLQCERCDHLAGNEEFYPEKRLSLWLAAIPKGA